MDRSQFMTNVLTGMQDPGFYIVLVLGCLLGYGLVYLIEYDPVKQDRDERVTTQPPI